jgi:hypothetical protein
MIKIRNLLSLSLLLFCLHSCKSKLPKNDLAKMNLSGEVILIKDVDDHYYFFNDQGFIIKSYLVSKTSREIANYYYIYNILSKIITNSRDENDLSEGIETYSYDNNKLQYKISTITKNTSKEIINSKTLYYYNGETLVMDSTIDIWENFFLPFFGIKTLNYYTYNRNNISKIETKSKWGYSKNDLNGQKIKYNNSYSIYENGLEIERENSDQKIKFEYDKDPIGNWITKKSIGAKNEFISTRVLFYKGDDITANEKTYNIIKESILNSNKSISKITDENNQDPTSNNEVVPEENNIQSNNTPQQQEKRKCYSCNGTGQCPKCSKPQRVRYKQGESPSDHNEIRLGMIVCTQCGGNLMNFGADKNKSCYLCKASGWLYCPECNVYGNGNYIGKCQRCKGTGFDN